MSSCKAFRLGPVALSATLTTNICNPATLTGGVAGGSGNTFITFRHLRVVNKTGAAVTFSLWIGATGANAAGTEFIGTAQSVSANSAYYWYGQVRLDIADFLVGGASAGTSLTLTGEGEIGIA